MATKTKDFLTKAAVKQNDGTLGSYTPIGASFEDVYDTRGDNSNGFYSLAQFFDNYLAFVKDVKLVHAGDTQPTNPNYCFWIDTGHTNHDTYGARQ